MRSVDEYDAWFRAEAEKLPADAKQAVLAALRNRQPWTIYRDLNDLRQARKLPESWGEILTAFWEDDPSHLVCNIVVHEVMPAGASLNRIVSSVPGTEIPPH